MPLRATLVRALAMAALGTVVAAPAPATPTAAPAAGAATHVGSDACGTCHAEALRAWGTSHHRRAMEPASQSSVLGNFADQTFTDLGTTTRFFMRDGTYLVRTDGPDGQPADYTVQYTFGVDPLQQYLLALPGGRLQALTVAWDTRPASAGGQRWMSLYPRETLRAGDPLHWTGGDQNWNFMCASCHSTDLRKRYDSTTATYDTKWSEISVGCEACHGPGSRHVEWARQRSGATAVADSGKGLLLSLRERAGVRWDLAPGARTAVPSTLRTTHTELEVCAPCHARRSVIKDDPRIAAPLLDAYLPALLTPGLYHADGQIDGEVYEYGSFLQSKMYRMGVTCSDCHEPHTSALRGDGNAVCGQCHAAAAFDTPAHHHHVGGSPGASCANCHMPTKTYMVVDVRHDHSLRVPRPDLSVTLGVPNPCSTCHADRGAAWARDQVRAWYGADPRGYQQYQPALHAERTGAADAGPLLAQLVLDAAQPGIARATAAAQLGRYPSPASGSALRGALADPDPLVRFAALRALEAIPPPQRLDLAAPLLADPIRAVRIEAAQELASVPAAAVAPDVRARIERGIDEYVAAQRVDADRPEAHVNLGTLYAERGQFAAAEAELRRAIALRPDYSPAYVNLADVYRVQRRDAEGEPLLRAGLAVAPKDAALHHTLGLLLVRTGRSDVALAELEQAARLEPDNARYSYVLGIALNSAGNPAQALDTLRAAHDRHPGDRAILEALVSISRDNGRSEDAAAYARALAALAP